MLKRWKFRSKMLLIPLLATLGFVSVLVISSWLGIRNGLILNRIESGYAPALELSRDLEEQLDATQRGLQDAVAALDVEALQETAQYRDVFIARIREEKLNPVLMDKDAERLIEDFDAYYELARATSRKLIEGDAGEGVMQSLEAMSAAYTRLRETLRNNTERDRRAMGDAFASARANQSFSISMFGAISFFLIVILGGLSIRISRQVVSAVATLASAAQELASGDMTRLASDAKLMAGGDLTRETSVGQRLLAVESEDELGRMATSFNLMVAKLGEISHAVNGVSSGLRDLVIHVQTTADEVSAGSNLVATSSHQAVGFNDSTVLAVESMTSALHEMGANTQNVARNAYSQSVTTDQTLSSVGQMLNSVKTVADAAERLVSITTKAGTTVNEGHQAMRSASDGMTEIGRVINASAGHVQELGGMADDIGRIVAVIDDIAEQTNLLALNATIEAARAGEHGMGFAVVADEVGKLAERSATSTREISDLVRRIQVQVEAAVHNMGQSTTIVADGASRTQQLTGHLDQILSSVSEVTECSREIRRATSEQSQGTLDIEKATAKLSELTEEIRAATTEQSTGTDQVVESIESIRGMVQQNALSSNDLASSAEELSRQARVMRELSSRFNVRANGKPTESRARFGLDTDVVAPELGPRPPAKTSPQRH